MTIKARAGTRSFLIAVTLNDSELADFIAETSNAGRKIEKIAVVHDAPYFRNAPPLLKGPKAKAKKAKAKPAISREDAILAILKKGPITGRDLLSAFEAYGFAPGGLAGARERLVKRGIVTGSGTARRHMTWSTAIGGTT